MPEFSLKTEILKANLPAYPGNDELAEMLRSVQLPISTKEDLYHYNAYLTSLIDRSPTFRTSNAMVMWYRDLRPRDPKQILKNEYSLRKEIVDPINESFGLQVKERGKLTTLPMQLEAWDQDHLTSWTNCQLPLVFTKLMLDRLKIDHSVVMGVESPHPYIFIPRRKLFHKIDMLLVHFLASGAEIGKYDGDYLDNRRRKESWAFLKEPLSMMRFIDYTNILTRMVDRSYKTQHRDERQFEWWKVSMSVFDEMVKEFGHEEELEKYWNSMWVNRTKDLRAEERLRSVGSS